eukprot:765744-Hanusia_phi.AAC.2
MPGGPGVCFPESDMDPLARTRARAAGRRRTVASDRTRVRSDKPQLGLRKHAFWRTRVALVRNLLEGVGVLVSLSTHGQGGVLRMVERDTDPAGLGKCRGREDLGVEDHRVVIQARASRVGWGCLTRKVC